MREQYDMKDKEFLPGYDTNENGAGNINFMKCALLPSWRETFKKAEAFGQQIDRGPC